MPDNPNVKEKDVGLAERLSKKSDDVDVLVEMEKGIFVSLGIPERDNVIYVPDKPYVFIGDELRVRDEAHSDGILFENIPIIMAHGVRDEQDKWTFVNGQNIPDTVNAYNNYAEREGLPKVEFVVACNRDEITEKVGVRVYEPNISTNIAYALGEELTVNTVLEEDGKSRIYVSAQGGIANLDTMQTARDISIIE